MVKHAQLVGRLIITRAPEILLRKLGLHESKEGFVEASVGQRDPTVLSLEHCLPSDNVCYCSGMMADGACHSPFPNAKAITLAESPEMLLQHIPLERLPAYLSRYRLRLISLMPILS